jgi:hemerythrin-like domain-containing protein
VALINRELQAIRETNRVNPVFLANAVHFMRLYADRTHHGKEEDILFRELRKKALSSDHRRIMAELVAEHRAGRQLVTGLATAMNEYRNDQPARVSDVASYLGELATFYPAHIEKEDRHFFYPIHRYFSPEELDALLLECYEFDRHMVHEGFRQLVGGMERNSIP